MAVLPSALHPRALGDASGGPPQRIAAPTAASQEDRSSSETLLATSRCSSGQTQRLTSWSSESTAVGGTKSEEPDSPRSMSSIVGHVRSLSHCPEGSRRVQDALGNAFSDVERGLLMKEVHGHAVGAMRCPHANHVLQKCISMMPPASLQFMVDEMMQDEGMAKKIAMHRYGIRIVQQLLAKCEASQLERLAEALLQDTVALARHVHGNYAIQHLLQFGTAEQQYRCVRTIEQNISCIGRNPYGVGVVAAAMEHASSQDRVWIARAVIQDPELLPYMAEMRHGPSAVSHVMAALPEQEQARACQSLMEAAAKLQASRYGKKVLALLHASGCHASLGCLGGQ